MDKLLFDIARACWEILLTSAPWVLIGFGFAGLLKGFLPPSLITRHLGNNRFGSVIKASLFGVPLPLCSCGVIPAAISLHKQGANKGATAAFLISVPETGVDSMAITWALLDPIMTIIRPVAAFVTATLAGVMINLLHQPAEATPVPAPEKTQCGCSSTCSSLLSVEKKSLGEKLKTGLEFAFGELLEDIGKWLVLGIIMAGVFTALLPADFFEQYLSNEFSGLLIMLLAGVPLYICATASTPIAAALVLKGLSPGAALVFLLAGPATNLATMTVVYRYFGRPATIIYLLAIAVCSVALGWLTNRWYLATGSKILNWSTGNQLDHHAGWSIFAALLLIVLLLRAWLSALKSRKASRSTCC
jgi:uncharacterized protein